MTETDHQLAGRVATQAGELLVALRSEMFARHAHSWDVMDAGDMEAHHFLLDALTEARPNDLVLSEEGRDDPARLEHDRVWIIDPLDGSNEYGERGRPDWAVHVALVSGGVPIAGAVALPALNITAVTDPAPAFPQRQDRPLRVITSRMRATYATARVAHALGAEIHPLGSAGAKAMAVVFGEADVYAHTGGQYEWDNCAPAAVAAAAGLHVSRVDGSPMRFNKRDVWSPDVLICRPELAETCLAALAQR
jgi:3'(2'), 5'-bisphosphate nucleotidase